MLVERPSTGQAGAVAERLLRRAPDGVEAFLPRVGGNDSWGFSLTVGRDRLLLKVKRRPNTPVGIYFHRRLREAGIPVPALIAFDAHGGPGGEACAIWEWVDGKPAAWGDGQPCPYDEAEFGALLRRIHQMRFDGPYGPLGDDPPAKECVCHPGLGPVSENWAGFFHCEWAARRYYDQGYLDRACANALASLPERLSADLDPGVPFLLHLGDIMHDGNMLLDPKTGRIVAVVDYVESLAGAPRWELAWVDYYFRHDPFSQAGFDLARFRAGYGTSHDPDDAVGRFYLVAILAFEKLLFLDPASPRGAWAVKTLRRVLSAFAGG